MFFIWKTFGSCNIIGKKNGRIYLRNFIFIRLFLTIGLDQLILCYPQDLQHALASHHQSVLLASVNAFAKKKLDTGITINVCMLNMMHLNLGFVTFIFSV